MCECGCERRRRRRRQWPNVPRWLMGNCALIQRVYSAAVEQTSRQPLGSALSGRWPSVCRRITLFISSSLSHCPPLSVSLVLSLPRPGTVLFCLAPNSNFTSSVLSVSVCLSVHQTVLPSVSLFFHQFLCSPISFSVHPSDCLSVRLCFSSAVCYRATKTPAADKGHFLLAILSRQSFNVAR